jgi:hypothetical protein
MHACTSQLEEATSCNNTINHMRFTSKRVNNKLLRSQIKFNAIDLLRSDGPNGPIQSSTLVVSCSRATPARSLMVRRAVGSSQARVTERWR